ncbi:MAG TPA: PP2C family serine/threonine-protein phosphatase [Pyrinomonadaceae bacterium]|jgi:protein phosphatase
MTEHSTEVPITIASVTDRGLSEKRPLNEDSFLADERRRIFAVADGVGGAEAGEVASQTAIEVLDEAFRHHLDGDDVEDLMEIAIQRANTSIHQMSREHPKLSMMATTIVALHLDGRRATIGHVGDSRLYRLSPEGRLYRETADHSVVEEEVRAGRMTPEQAANHPSRNVISRALGAEASVEVDMKTMEAEDGTLFLLCSDGITRHIPDEEIRELLSSTPQLDAACAEMKRRCFERGAEDNLTAVVIRVGERRDAGASGDAGHDTESDWDEERTMIAERPSSMATAKTISMEIPIPPAHLQKTLGDLETAAPPPPPLRQQPQPPQQQSKSASSVAGDSSFAYEADAPRAAVASSVEARPAAAPPTPEPARRSKAASLGRILAFMLLLVGASAAAFLGGLLYHSYVVDKPSQNLSYEGDGSPSPSPDAPLESASAGYERRRREVDRAPAAEARRMSEEMSGQPLTSRNAEFLYLYGRALLLSGKPKEAMPAFERAIARMQEEQMTPEYGQLKIETRLATAAAALRANDPAAAQNAARALDDVIQAETSPAQASDANAAAPSLTTSPQP